MSNRYPRETVEFMAVNVAVDGVAVLTGVEFAVTTGVTRPSTWEAPTTLDGAIGIMIDGQTPGTYKVWAQITDSPEIPVVECGRFIIT